MNATYEELRNIKDIGDILANNIVTFFYNNKDLIDNLKQLGINMEYLGEKRKYSADITGKKFVITGTISFMTRDEIIDFLESYNGMNINSVSKNTDVLILGSNPGSKFDKAKKLNIPIWDEETLKEIIKKHSK